MLKRNLPLLVVAGLVLGGAAVAWAGGLPARPTLVAAQAGETPSTTAPARLTPEEREAKMQALRTCLQQAGQDDAARRACFDAAGVRKPRIAGEHHKPGRPGAGALGRAVHGTVVVPGENGSWQEVTFDRGTVAAATDESKIVLDRPDGQSVTLSLTADTRYHGIDGAGAIREGRPALVVSKDGKATQVVQGARHH